MFEGLVVRIPDFAEEHDQQSTFPVVIVFDNSEDLLRDGMTGYAKIETGETSLVGIGLRRALSVLKVECKKT